jgi:hypothetical protein
MYSTFYTTGAGVIHKQLVLPASEKQRMNETELIDSCY